MLFVVAEDHGASWDRTRPLREQAQWTDHAEFMDALVDEGFIVLGGPLGEDRAMLIVEAASEEAARARLAVDPWEVSGLLVVASVEPWEILLGELPRRPPPG
jgi:uncharacterized protein